MLPSAPPLGPTPAPFAPAAPRLSWRFLLAFTALRFVVGEAHELAHTGLGRLLCGGWGPRDFNAWGLRAGCALRSAEQLAVSYAGPALTFALVWLGHALLGAVQPRRRQSLGLALVFANLPFARLLSVLLGKNDEVFALRALLPYPAAWAGGALLVALVLLPPLWRAYGVLRAVGRPGLFWGLLVLPTPLAFLVVQVGLNKLLAHGWLAAPGWLGAPLLVSSWTAAMAVLLAFTFPYLGRLWPPRPADAAA